MRKRIYVFIILMFIIMVFFKILSHHYNIDVFLNYNDFVVDGDTIIKFNSSGNVVIPKVINGVKIKKIGNNAFDAAGIESIVIPDSIVSIGDYAFANNNLKSLTIPDSVIEIGEGAFMNNSLINLVMPSQINLGNACFNNNLLENKDAFFYKNENELISYGGKIKGNVVINDGVEVIGERAFFNTDIVSVSLPSSVREIKDEAFRKNNLVDIYLPSNIIIMGIDVFLDNDYLVDINIDNAKNSLSNYPWGLKNSNINWLKNNEYLYN